ncbi:hypothetical protein JNUCC1_02238 [Lentibacillus sp. JNUCC-1]|uniref:hypothetical protein n=1 Tax=Lentibacillus sp. JNUCC-1 TaxID=2654513 RepID=UPI0012E90338|nr:hypothetical protein [Lentibacillus sp. JNUCC-1]MUV38139.1 hypothetical protein [Lentibacillus sp. JNUCC-1]MUV38400.1 hypothetical protein [Lentibacillus sp. JNUCC-1]
MQTVERETKVRVVRGAKSLSRYLLNEIGIEMSEATIYRLIKQENIPFNRPSAGILLFNLNAIDEWLLHEDYGSI